MFRLLQPLYTHADLEILFNLNAVRPSSKASLQSVRITLPPPAGIARLWPGKQLPVALPQACQMTLTSLSQAMILALELLQAVHIRDERGTDGLATDVSRQRLRAWLLGHYQRLWTVSKTLDMFEPHPDGEPLISAFLLCFKVTCLPALEAGEQRGTLHRNAAVTSRCLAGILHACAQLPRYKSLHGELARCLVRIAGAVRSRRCVLEIVEEYLNPVIYHIVQDEQRFPKLAKDLQVCAYYSPA